MDTRVFAFQYDYTCTLRFEWSRRAQYKPRISLFASTDKASKKESYSISTGDVFRVTDSISFSPQPPLVLRLDMCKAFFLSFSLSLFLSLSLSFSYQYDDIHASRNRRKNTVHARTYATDRSPYVLHKLYRGKIQATDIVRRI